MHHVKKIVGVAGSAIPMPASHAAEQNHDRGWSALYI